MKQSVAIEIVLRRLNSDVAKYAPPTSTREGALLIQEECADLLELLRNEGELNAKTQASALRAEAVSIAASAVRFLIDLC